MTFPFCWVDVYLMLTLLWCPLLYGVYVSGPVFGGSANNW